MHANDIGKRNKRFPLAVKVVALIFLVLIVMFTFGRIMLTVIEDDPFISTWDTTKLSEGSSDMNQVKLPLEEDGHYDFTVDWGDGVTDRITGTDRSGILHTYEEAGVYNITITGELEGWSFDDGGDKLKILDISRWGGFNPGNSGGYFFGTANLEITAGDTPDLSTTTTMEDAFRESGISDVPKMNKWDLGGVDSMEGMFFNASYFDSNICEWNVGSVRDMWGIFNGADSFNSDIGDWDVSSVEDMGAMFHRAGAFDRDIGEWNVANVKRMDGMFYGAASFNSDISGWNVESVVNMRDMFRGARSFNQDIGTWDVGSVVNMSDMFRNAAAFNAEIGGWDTGEVKWMEGMFYDASVFDSDIGGWDVKQVEAMSEMFMSAGSFDSDIGDWDTGNVKIMRAMFCSTPFNQDIGDWDVSNVMDMYAMFYGARYFNQDLSGWDVGNVRNMKHMFRDASAFDRDLGSWDVSEVRDMDGMLAGASLSTVNYDSLLIGWANLPSLQENVSFNAGDSTYYEGARAREVLEGGYLWSIQDGGKASSH